jgi:hypothetical protein
MQFAVVCRRDDGRKRVFGRYTDRAQAEHYAASLNRIGCLAEIEGPPEFGNSRRRFLIAACMAGWVHPTRVVERVVAEIEHDGGE